jgi:hypothetical protein
VVRYSACSGKGFRGKIVVFSMTAKSVDAFAISSFCEHMFQMKNLFD